MIDFQVAYDKLASLETVDEIADMLTNYGVRGQVADPHSCAISMWMKAQTGEEIATNRSHIRIIEKSTGITVPGTMRPTTPAVGEFIFQFDNGRYPELMVTRY